MWSIGNSYGCGGTEIAISELGRQLVWMWWSGNCFGYDGAAIGIGVVDRQMYVCCGAAICMIVVEWQFVWV